MECLPGLHISCGRNTCRLERKKKKKIKNVSVSSSLSSDTFCVSKLSHSWKKSSTIDFWAASPGELVHVEPVAEFRQKSVRKWHVKIK